MAKPPAGRKVAVLVGVRHYSHSKLNDLTYTENDAAELADVLRSAGFRVALLTDAAGAQAATLAPTAANVRRELAAALDGLTKDDTMLVALAGHGRQPPRPQDR